MKNISSYYLTFIKILITVVVLFAIFGTLNDAIIQLITGSSFPDASFLNNQKYLTGLYILQHIGFAFIYFVLYKNHLQFLGFGKNKKAKKLSPLWSKYLSIFGIAFILLFYMALLF
ncbi:hypothetical protein [Bacillus sp. B1-b2]|uniref:hypothetical protein n=1 Tax=Bacillus sp. B1-b2 TaxID=2653201 RepID=UPI0012617B82|nr:hypothetical protein [Bacillus sp. B1-b2]KAB7673144.1 hypothetical protein F9279_01655 [Bacillus sp. B1-b2]